MPSDRNGSPAPNTLQEVGADLLELAASLHDAATDRARAAAVQGTTLDNLVARLGRPLTSDERMWLADCLDNARAFCQAVTAAEGDVMATAASLDATLTGLVVVDGRGVVVYANRTAARLLRAVLALGAPHDLVNRTLEALRRREAELGAEAVHREPITATRTMEFRRVHVPRPTNMTDVTGAAPVSAFLVTAVEACASPNATTIARALCITPAEARLCAELAQGCSVADAAARLGIKMPTARSQLRSVFAKTRTRRQAELIDLLASLPAESS